MASACVSDAQSSSAPRGVAAMQPGHYGAAGTRVVLAPATMARACNVQGNPANSALVADVERLFGVTLPLTPNTSTRTAAWLALWLGPRSWLLLASAGAATASISVDFEACRDALNAGGGALFDVSAGRVAFTLRGDGAATVLASGCPLDLDVRVFPPGHCAQSVFGHVNVLLYRHAQASAFTVWVATSLAADLWHSFCAAAAEGGYEVARAAPFDAD
jgi:sarcosine oxidase, subunit gamma